MREVARDGFHLRHTVVTRLLEAVEPDPAKKAASDRLQTARAAEDLIA